MESLLKLFSPEFFSNIGMFVILLLIIFREKLFRLSFLNGRKEDKGNWFEKFIAATEGHTRATIESSKEFADAVKASSDASAMEIRNLANVIKDMSEAMSQRANKAISQHEEILHEIKVMDVPRRR